MANRQSSAVDFQSISNVRYRLIDRRRGAFVNVSLSFDLEVQVSLLLDVVRVENTNRPLNSHRVGWISTNPQPFFVVAAVVAVAVAVAVVVVVAVVPSPEPLLGF